MFRRRDLPLTAPEVSAAHATVGAGKLIVTSSEDSGAGSLRDAVATASADPSIESIRIGAGVGVIAPLCPIVYRGAQLIDFDGASRTIDASAAGGTGLTFIAHQRVRVRNVAVVNVADVGVAVLVPTTASGVVSIDLDIVTVSGNAGNGVLINDRRSTSRTPTPPRTPDRMRRSTRRSAPSAPCRTPSARSTAMASASTRAGPRTWRSA